MQIYSIEICLPAITNIFHQVFITSHELYIVLQKLWQCVNTVLTIPLNFLQNNTILLGAIACFFLIIVILIYVVTRQKLLIKKFRKEAEKQSVRMKTLESELKKQQKRNKEQIEHSDKQNELIHQQTIELEKHRQHLEKIVERRTRELKIAKEKAEESDALKTSFLENMSHEIRTPMNAIIGFASLLNSKTLSDSDREKYLLRITNNSYMLLQLIEDIIDISKLQSNQMQVIKSKFSINESLRNIYDDFESEREELGRHEIKVELKIDERNTKDFLLYADPYHFKRITSKLLNNALKYTEKGFIRFGYDPLYKSEFDTEPYALQFFVEDTGIGIPHNKTGYIFDRFRKIEDGDGKLYRGAGLGLFIAKKLITLMGGKIWVNSRINQGSIFYFTLPYVDISDVKSGESRSNPVFRQEKQINYDWRKKTILIAEDEVNNFIYLSAIIKQTGANLLLAKDGLEAVEYIKENRDVDLVLLDIMMPNMNGYEAAKKIKKLRPGLPIIAQTAYSDPRQREKSLASGCDGYISKPYNTSDLLKLISNFL